MILDIPLESVSAADLDALVAGATSESRRLDFKLTLDVTEREGQIELLRDVVAFANSDGGLLIYGIREGEGEDRGVAVALEGLPGSPDGLGTTVSSLLRDNVDERITGILQRHIPLGNGRFAYLIKVPGSHLAPHMISGIRTASPRFFQRANTANEPMSARQIKDLARQRDHAIDRAANRIAERIRLLRDAGAQRVHPFTGESAPPNQAVLHLVPLFPQSGGWRYDNPSVATRLTHVTVFGYGEQYESLSYTQHGAFLRFPGVRHVAFLRDGALECQMFDALEQLHPSEPMVFLASRFEQAVADALVEAETLTADGLLPLPLLVQFHLLGVGGAPLQATRRFDTRSRIRLPEPDVISDAILLNDWGERSTVLRQIFNHVWQAWGYSSCQHFSPDGELRIFDREGYVVNASAAQSARVKLHGA